jgi:hypothetical protein
MPAARATITETERLFRVARWFAQWDMDYGCPPKAKQIMDAWQVHRATAFRWLKAWRDASS